MANSLSFPSINPDFFGQLDSRSPGQGEPHELFRGEEQFLSRRQRATRLALLNSIAPTLKRLLGQDENVLYATAAMRTPTFFQSAGLGALSYAFFQMALVFTDRRLIEIQLDFKGKRPDGRVRSFTWPHVATLKRGFGGFSFALTPARGRKQSWRLPLRGDRRLLKLLLPRIQDRLLGTGTNAAETLPVQHCPDCGVALGSDPKECSSCRALFRSSRLVSLLSVAFPGAGLIYAGHPALGTLNLLGEITLFIVATMLLLEAKGASALLPALAGAAFLFLVTKAHSVHLGRTLVARGRTETPERRARFKRLGMAGGAVSVLAIGSALALHGSLPKGLDHDLDFAVGKEWTGARSAAQWASFKDETTMRSQWTHEEGWRVSVLAYSLGAFESLDGFREDFSRGAARNGDRVVTEDSSLPAPFQGFRSIEAMTNKAGKPVVVINYFVYDPEGRDVHHLLIGAVPEQAAEAEAHLRGLLERGRWIELSPPSR
ncbi:MAG TPA: hypothetical protein VFT43_02545 [Candidatus Polarisedimenticolia bacterium]|nr:hypothetical protein [Candidatus Polarisedimenticolia bacterium]